MDHFGIKLFAISGSDMDWPALIPVFHRWIRENVLPGTPIDVADYAHVPDGPGILLVAHDAIYSVDNRAGRVGFLYSQRTRQAGSSREKLNNAYDSALSAARLLEKENLGGQTVAFSERTFEVSINDRLAGPNTAETEEEIRPLVESLYIERFGCAPHIERDRSDPRGLFRLNVTQAE